MVTKPEAIQAVNNHLGAKILNNHNTHFANINNVQDVWWFNISPSKFNNDLHLILNQEASFLWLKIEGYTFGEPEIIFRLRPDTNKIDLEISSNPNNYRYMRDIKSGGTNYNFTPYIEHEFN